MTAPAVRFVVLLASPSRLVMPPKKLQIALASHMTSRLLFESAFRRSGSIFSIAALLITCSITSITASMRA